MKILYYTFFIFLLATQTTFASISTIEQELINCLKEKYSSYDMIFCSKSASDKLELIINKTSVPENLINNQKIWSNYKTSTQNSIIKILNKELGSMYQELSASNIYTLNKNRLFILDYVNNKYSYKPEKYISKNLNTCLKISQTDSSKEKCYIKQQQEYINNQAILLQQLKNKMKPEAYISIQQNQKEWIKYRNNTIDFINNTNKLSNLQKAQITKILEEERNSQLYALMQIYKN